MGGLSEYEKNVYNKRCVEWVKGFLAKRCIVRPNRWALSGELYAAYVEYAKGQSQMGWSLLIAQNRFARALSQVFKENNWFLERQCTPDGHHRIYAGCCLKELATERTPDELLAKSMKKAGLYKTTQPRGKSLVEMLTEHANPDSPARATEAVNVAERDALAKKLWEEG